MKARSKATVEDVESEILSIFNAQEDVDAKRTKEIADFSEGNHKVALKRNWRPQRIIFSGSNLDKVHYRKRFCPSDFIPFIDINEILIDDEKRPKHLNALKQRDVQRISWELVYHRLSKNMIQELYCVLRKNPNINYIRMIQPQETQAPREEKNLTVLSRLFLTRMIPSLPKFRILHLESNLRKDETVSILQKLFSKTKKLKTLRLGLNWKEMIYDEKLIEVLKMTQDLPNLKHLEILPTFTRWENKNRWSRDEIYYETAVLDYLGQLSDLITFVVIPSERVGLTNTELIIWASSLKNHRNLKKLGISVYSSEDKSGESNIEDNDALWDGLGQLSNLRHFSLEYQHPSFPAPGSFAKNFSKLRLLQSLSLKFQKIVNFDHQMWESIISSIKNFPTLENLALSLSRIPSTLVKGLATLPSSLEVLSSLQQLYLNLTDVEDLQTNIIDDIAQSLEKCQNITDLTLQIINSRQDPITQTNLLKMMMKKASTLEYLDFCTDIFEKAGLVLLGKYLEKFSRLKKFILDVSKTPFTKAELTEFCEALNVHPTLEYFELAVMQGKHMSGADEIIDQKIKSMKTVKMLVATQISRGGHFTQYHYN